MENKSRLSTIILLFILLAGSSSWAGQGNNSSQLISKGKEFFQNGDYEHAAAAWEQAIPLLDTVNDLGTYADTVVHLASVYQALGHHDRALAAFDSALPIVEKNSDLHHNAQFFSSLGDIHLSLGNTDQADKYMTKGLEQARLSKNPRVLATVLTDVGNLLVADGDYEGAAAAYSEAVIFAGQLENEPELKSKPLINYLTATYLGGNDQDIEAAMDEAAREIENLPVSGAKARYLVSSGLIIRIIRNDPELEISTELDKFMINTAVRVLNSAKQISTGLEDYRLASYAYGYMGQLYEDENRLSDALKLTRSAVFFARQGDFPQSLYLWQWQLGRIFNALGDNENAVKAYKRAVSTLNPVRGELFRGLRLQEDTFSTQVKPVYLGLADLLLKQAEKSGSQELLREARDTMELLKTAELEDFFADECVTLMRSKVKPLDQTPPRTAMIYPIILPERLVLLLTLPDGMIQVSVPVGSLELEETVKFYRWRLQNRMSNRFLVQSKMLYDWCIGPVEAELKAREITTLVIAPDGALRLIPLSTLNDGTRFLVEKYAIAVIPAITLTDAGPFQKENIEILLSGLSEGRQGFSSLPSVVEELRDIKKIMDGRIVLNNKDFNISNLTREFKSREYSVVHMATHGVFGGTPEESFLLNYDSRLTMNGLEKLISFSRFRENPVELLTLSACQTALGNERAALGLAGVAVKAGVRSAIATLWYVDDEATSLAIREFYRQIKKPGISKAQALQNTQKKLIEQRRYWHPLYWGPFLLIGNWM